LTRPSFAPALRHQVAIATAFVAVLTLVLLLSPGRAMAGLSGQLGEPWGPPVGGGEKQVFNPHAVGVDPADGSVFIASPTADFTETTIRKFSATGDYQGSVTLPGKNYEGIAVDPKLHRFYLLEAAAPEAGVTTAAKILAFSTTPVDEKLEAAMPSELTLPTGTATVFGPQEVVLDPSTGDLVIVGNAENGHMILQRIDVDPMTGASSLGNSFIDEEGKVLSNNAIAIDAKGVT
jgi:hypothetical protein